MKTFTNYTASPVGLYGTDSVLEVAPAMGADTASLVPTFYSQQIIDIYTAAGLGKVMNGEAAENVVPPTMSASPKVGTPITLSGGTWVGDDPITYTYSWIAAATTIPGAYAATYTPVAADVGKYITVRMTGTNAQGNDTVTVTSSGVVTA